MTIFWHPETYRCYLCSRCTVELRVPRRLNRRLWFAWVADNAVNITWSPLLFSACEKVSRILAGARSRRVPVPIDIGAIVCPNCGDRMAIGNIDTNPLVCPRCGSRSASRDRKHPLGIILTNGGPPDDKAVRRVIQHLKELAETPKGHDP